ncbi:DUF3243 domain-containing protein [Thermohalobacter berrensis]|uniref:DUF3243 domain-containing protein n=1 Tax=Thermohalobacter berrensis TaxID=99594 RepID=A0A419SZ16_9FIRM|nr:DUF3243 domain-containing protein [Thermohalobacter berrensis]RKD30500.1 hypothetical protein BET03_03950 [Thermohalobacter berrensis]
MGTLENWHKWKQQLNKAVQLGETVGMSDETINNIAERVGTFLANNVEPQNDEERLLKELWDVADEEDRKVLAKLVVRLTDK